MTEVEFPASTTALVGETESAKSPLGGGGPCVELPPRPQASSGRTETSANKGLARFMQQDFPRVATAGHSGVFMFPSHVVEYCRGEILIILPADTLSAANFKGGGGCPCLGPSASANRCNEVAMAHRARQWLSCAEFRIFDFIDETIERKCELSFRQVADRTQPPRNSRPRPAWRRPLYLNTKTLLPACTGVVLT